MIWVAVPTGRIWPVAVCHDIALPAVCHDIALPTGRLPPIQPCLLHAPQPLCHLSYNPPRYSVCGAAVVQQDADASVVQPDADASTHFVVYQHVDANIILSRAMKQEVRTRRHRSYLAGVSGLPLKPSFSSPILSTSSSSV